ncbi:hypothetical protein CMI47_01000 [Candidatus Pacearchaeota archaeon]|nr:hypothetical protein [Candidatus Pacearchaeota archaeon]|tara:strand:+ start:1278 stop:1703 length:426 start_codon:yes stop_codon:yes gene_type:complete
MNGTWLTLGTVGALAAAGALRRGSAARWLVKIGREESISDEGEFDVIVPQPPGDSWTARKEFSEKKQAVELALARANEGGNPAGGWRPEPIIGREVYYQHRGKLLDNRETRRAWRGGERERMEGVEGIRRVHSIRNLKDTP